MDFSVAPAYSTASIVHALGAIPGQKVFHWAKVALEVLLLGTAYFLWCLLALPFRGFANCVEALFLMAWAWIE